MKTRLATKTDLPFIVEIFKDVYYPKEGRLHFPKERTAYFSEKGNSTPINEVESVEYHMIFGSDMIPHGVISCKKNTETNEAIVGMNIVKEKRNKEIGRRALSRMVTDLKENSYRVFGLIPETNQACMKMSLACGARIDSILQLNMGKNNMVTCVKVQFL